MKEKTGQVFRISQDNQPIAGCTVSRAAVDGDNAVIYFSLAKNTDISAEIFPYHKLIIMSAGTLEVYGGNTARLGEGECCIAPAGTAAGMRTADGAVYTEIQIRRTDFMNDSISAGKAFSLAELVPYQQGRIVNMDIMHNDKMKFVVMAFDEGTGLSEHAAPGEALIFALDGEGVITYEGTEHKITAGENFSFAKGGLHSVRADKKFKMALLLTLE